MSTFCRYALGRLSCSSIQFQGVWRSIRWKTTHKPTPQSARSTFRYYATDGVRSIPRAPNLRGRNGASGKQESRDKRQLWLLIIPVTTFCLGTWQIFRLQWKLDLIEQLERKTKQPPIPIPKDIFKRVEELEYCRVTFTGYFDHEKELHLWPRTLNTDNVGGGGGSRRNTEPGACVITPFYCHELGEWILVNRGWVPHRKMDPSTRAVGQVKGDVSLTAVVRVQENRAPFSPKNDPTNNHWSYKDVALMAQCAETAPLLLDADATTTVHGGPIGGQTRVSLRNEHLQYVFTWYALSLATGYMFYTLWTKTKKK